ncbi:MAG: dihydrofolate reductase [Burkholderiaceae bacterium]
MPAAPTPPHPLLSLIAAIDRAGGIGKGNGLLVRLSEDLRHFKRTTLGCPVIMGRRTWDSIGKPLPGRRNLVVTRDPAWQAAGAEAVHSLDAALARVVDAPKVFVIGGAQIFEQALPRADELVLTEIDASFDADTFFPALPPGAFVETARETMRSDRGFDYSFVTYRRAPTPR